MDGAENRTLLQFVPFSSTVEATFWHKLCQLKLEVYALDDSAVDVEGYYINHDPAGLPSRFSVDYTSFTKNSADLKNTFLARGQLINKNTIEAFKELDKPALMNSAGKEIWDDIITGKALEEPNRLNRFLLLTFADLKKYHFYYWFAFPSVVYPEKAYCSKTEQLSQVLTTEEVGLLQSAHDIFCETHHAAFFIVERLEGKFVVHSLSALPAITGQNVWIGFADPSTLAANPGWPLRNLLALLTHHLKTEVVKYPILCWRDVTRDGVRSTGHSLLLQIDSVELDENVCPHTVGWEKNERGKMGPRIVDLSATMDPTRLAEAAVDLNLKLMKWRLMPELNLEVINEAKCLLLGAGTLGCNVARNLMAWGVREITFVDDGRVAYSNPVRQSLFTFKDCQSGSASKADCAAKALKLISPCVKTKAVNLRIPMPGHHVSDLIRSQVESDVKTLSRLIDEHDAVFMLTDTRESRWLPTMLSAFKGKIVINAALGFDSYLVMRHGQRQPWIPGQEGNKTEGILKGAIPGRDLGCYFCNDVVAPGDSTRDRTLDQQCTVTRPGVSMIASALAVELLVSLLQHPEKGNAAAEITQLEASGGESLLGLVPHSIRGFLSRFQQILPATEAFYNCTGCSPLILERYAKEGFAFLLEVFNSPDILASVAGLADLHNDGVSIEVLEYTDDEED